MRTAVPGPLRIRRSMKVAAAACGAGLLALACAPASNPPTLPVRTANPLVTEIVATGNDAGRAASAAVSKDGVPFVSYLLLTPNLKPSQLPPPVVPNTPQPPAVAVASYSAQDGLWSRQSASAQDYTKAKGTDATIATKGGKFLPGVNTAIAVDGQGKEHVVWATPSGLFYTDNT